VQADVGKRGQVADAFKLIREQLGQPEVLVYNAAAGPFGALADVTPEQFENALQINALGAFLCAKECVPGMLERGGGTMLFTGATAGVKAGARSVTFGPGNFAKRGLAQSLARDLGPLKGFMSPGSTSTEGSIRLIAPGRRWTMKAR
jgi:NAD(P)-dependent dehydrogenase (short-subunit alcohol dehydrogenase family)